MKKQENKKTLSIWSRILAGVMALVLFAGTVFGLVMYLI
jgi:hypothetical protein